VPAPRPATSEEIRDLGFGAVVASESRTRLLNRDGTFNVRRSGLGFWSSLNLYHAFLTTTWPVFLFLMTGSYVLINAAFAGAYLACGPRALAGAAAGISSVPFLRAFFFSVQTFSTIGYGMITPVGPLANLVVTLEALVGLLWLALATGLIYARFARPTARIIFSRSAVVAPYDGATALMFRIVNGRSNQIIELAANVLLARFEDDRGRSVRRFHPLPLVRRKVVFFPLAWTLVHPIDETSPLHGLTESDLRASRAEVLVLLTGIDETFSQSVHSRSSYTADEIVWHARFADIFDRSEGSENLTIDIGRLDEIVKLERAKPPAG
jgi:inward rectifier potassium channel